MSWGRFDDGFDTHPKLLGLKTDERRWTWLRIILYTCRYRSPVIPENVQESVKRATTSFLEDCITLGLIDVSDTGEKKVHDWHLYNGETVAERVAAFLAQKPDATANQVHKAVGGKREVVLAVIAEIAKRGSQLVPERFPIGSPAGSQVVPDQSTLVVPLAGARAPVPPPAFKDQEHVAVDVAEETSRLALVDAIANGAEQQQTTEEDDPEPVVATLPDLANVLQNIEP